MRILRHDNHFLWLGVMTLIGLSVYLTVSYSSRVSNASRATLPEHENTTRIAETAETIATREVDDNKPVYQEAIDAVREGDESHSRQRKTRHVRFNNEVSEKVVEEKTVHTDPTYIYLDLAKQDFLKDPFTGRVVLQLRTDVAPRTCANFIKLCEDKKYVNTPFHRVIKDFMLQGGDIVHQDGTGSYSIYGGEGSTFNDEPFVLRHDQIGVLSMANSGPNTNGSQFFITTQATPHLDGKHVVFGKVVQGMEYVHDIEREMTDANNAPIRKCYIMNCGVLDVTKLQVQTPNDVSSTSTVSAPQPSAINTVNPMSVTGQTFDQSVVPPIEPSPFSL